MITLPLAIAVLASPVQPAKRRLARFVVFSAGVFAAFSPWLIKNQIMTGSPVFPLANTVFKASPPGWGAEQDAQWDRAHTALPEEQSLGGRLTTFWRHVPGDRYQRFGPMILVLGIVGLARRKRDRGDLTLLLIVILQLGVWLFATHLFARFAVVFLIPLALLAGRSFGNRTKGVRVRAVITFVILGAIWNFAFAMRLVVVERALGAPASLIYNGDLPGYEYFKLVNRELPPDAKILLVADAKAFYFQRDVDYGVVFNKNPFIEGVGSAKSDREIIHWLLDQGYTHVLVNWSEVRRLTSTYGFAKEVTEAFFDDLRTSGLVPVREFEHPRVRGRYITFYEVSGR